MKVAVISDIHGNYEALKAVAADFKVQNIDSVIVLGDTVCRGKSPTEVWRLTESLNPICLIKGNTDDWLNEVDENFVPKNDIERYVVKEVEFVKSSLGKEVVKKVCDLPEKQLIEIENKTILCVHGSDRKINEGIGIERTPEEIEDLINRMDYDILLCGHTHSPYVVEFGGKLIINVGSVGMPNDDTRASYGILNFDNDNFEYSIRKVQF